MDVGALPMDYALCGNDTCVLCHVVTESDAAAAEPARPLVTLGRPGD